LGNSSVQQSACKTLLSNAKPLQQMHMRCRHKQQLLLLLLLLLALALLLLLLLLLLASVGAGAASNAAAGLPRCILCSCRVYSASSSTSSGCRSLDTSRSLAACCSV
jgi:hypothetical protein